MTKAKPRLLIIDTDPSPDDATAFLMALGSPNELEVLALTTVGGNVSLEQTTTNVLKSLELVGRTDIPLYMGASKPLKRELITAPEVHGASGLEGYDLPEPTAKAAKGFAPDKIIELVMNNKPNTVTICAIAPLTNIAIAMQKEPKLANRLQEIVFMGGARSEGGNVTPAAEYNIYVDPEAAEIVFNSGTPITMSPLDCTHKALSTDARLEKLRAVGTPHMEAFYHLLKFNRIFDQEKMNLDGGPLHDPTTIAYLLKPEIFKSKKVNVTISLDNELTRGMSVIDWWGKMNLPINTNMLYDLDSDAYYDLVIERLALANKKI
jgi:purine nucleosidase